MVLESVYIVLKDMRLLYTVGHFESKIWKKAGEFQNYFCHSLHYFPYMYYFG